MEKKHSNTKYKTNYINKYIQKHLPYIQSHLQTDNQKNSQILSHIQLGKFTNTSTHNQKFKNTNIHTDLHIQTTKNLQTQTSSRESSLCLTPTQNTHPSHAQKLGTLIPNRIFVGGISNDVSGV